MRRCLQLSPLVVLLLALMLVAGPASAQYVINNFDTSVADTMFQYVHNTSGARASLVMTDDAATKEMGNASLKCVWRVDPRESYGGFDLIQWFIPRSVDTSYYANKYRAFFHDSVCMDFSGGQYLSLWYNNTVKSNAPTGTIQLRFHLHEAGGQSTYWTNPADEEDWYYQTANVLDQDPGWHELIIPLKDNGGGAPNDQGFTLPGWAGQQNNGTLDLDKIVGYTIEWTSPVYTSGDSTASGEVYFDNLRLMGTRYQPIDLFNDFAADTAKYQSRAGWGGPLGHMTLYNEPVDTMIAPSALGLDWGLNCSNTWGGYTNFDYKLPVNTYLPDMSTNRELIFYVKVVQPLASSTGTIGNKVTMRLVLYDMNGGEVDWYNRCNVRIDTGAVQLGWQQVRAPLKANAGGWTELSQSTDGFFAVNGSPDGIMHLAKIGGYKIEFSASRDGSEPYANDLVYTGKILLSMLAPAGYHSIDVTPPAPVSGVNVTKGTFEDVVTWTDVPNEARSTYNVYFSDKSFSTVAGIDDVPPMTLPLLTELAHHVLIAPLVDQDVSYYYGVTATDSVGNQNLPVLFGPVTNKAKGVATFATAPPANYAVDGKVAKWTAAGIKPVLISKDSGTAHAASNSVIDNDADCSARVYMAMDAANFYILFDIADDIVLADSTNPSTWLEDSPDLFIGLYDWRGPHHGGLARGATPEYHLRFCVHRILIDNLSGHVLATPGPNYYWKKKGAVPGYIVEAKIPFADFAAAAGNHVDSVFTPVEGMRIPIDFEINDRDDNTTPPGAGVRQGALCFSILNDDNSWADMWRWTNTWVGAKWTTTGIAQVPGVAVKFDLSQNYPNPFNPSTQIQYSLAKAGQVTLKVYDVLGRQVATLVNEVQHVGNYHVVFNGIAGGRSLASGVYFYRLEAGSYVSTKKMMFLK